MRIASQLVNCATPARAPGAGPGEAAVTIQPPGPASRQSNGHASETAAGNELTWPSLTTNSNRSEPVRVNGSPSASEAVSVSGNDALSELVTACE